ILAIRGLGDFQLAILERKPGPARAELRRAGIEEILTELVKAPQVGLDRRLERRGKGPAAAIRLHPLPEMDVVVMLAGIVEEPLVLAIALLDDLLERLAF